MVRLPRIIGPGSIPANVTDNCCIADYLCPLPVVGVVVKLFVFGPLEIAQLLYALPMHLAPAFIAELATIKARFLKFHSDRILAHKRK